MTKTESPRRHILVSILLSALALSVGFLASYGLSLLRKPPVLREPPSRKYNVEVYALQAVDLREIVNAFGTARAEKEVVLSAQVAGEVSETHPQLNVGLHVQASSSQPPPTGDSDRYTGSLLVRIDPRNYEERVELARHRLAEDQSELKRVDQEEANLDRLHEKVVADHEDSRREYDNVRQLRKKDITTDSDVRRAQMELRQHEKNLVQISNDKDLLPVRREVTQRHMESHRADLRLAELELARTFVRAPFDGMLSSVHVERGQYVRVGDPLVTVTAAAEVEVPLSIALDDYAKLLPDVLERNYPSVDLAANETAPPRWNGRIVRVSPKADEHTRTGTVFVLVDNTVQATPLLPGTFVHARIDGPILKRAKAVPRDAVLNGKAFVEHDGKATQREVTISRTLHGLALVDNGLESGDRVVLTNLDVLFDGAQVNTPIERSLSQELDRQRIRSARLLTTPETASLNKNGDSANE